MQFYFLLTAAVTAAGIALKYIIKNPKIYRAAFFIFAFAVLGSVSAFRYDVGYDYNYVYVPLYEPILFDPFAAVSGREHELGFVLLERLIALLSNDYQMLFIVTGYLTAGLFMLYYYLYSPSPAASVFLFLSLGQFYCSMNFIRQTLAGAICLFALPLLRHRKFWRYCAIVLLASLFHVSALIMLVFYFVNLIPVNVPMLLIYIPASIVFFLSSSGMIELVTQFIYDHYNAGDPSVAMGFPLTVLAVLIFLFLVVFLNRKMLTKRDEKNYIYVNYAFFSMLFMFLGTKHAILSRFAIFFEFAIPLGFAAVISEWRKDFPLLRGLIEDIRKKTPGIRRAAIAYAACLLAVFGGSAAVNVDILSRDSHGVVPYKLIFSQPFYTDSFGGAGDTALEEPDVSPEEAPLDGGAAENWEDTASWEELPEEPAG